MTSYLTKQKKNSRMNYKKKTLSKKKTFRKKNRKNTKRNRRKVNKSIKSIKYGGMEANSNDQEEDESFEDRDIEDNATLSVIDDDGGMEANSNDQDTIIIRLRTTFSNEEVEIEVNPKDRVLTAIRKALNLQQTHNITVWWMGQRVEEDESFEYWGMLDNAILSVIQDTIIIRLRTIFSNEDEEIEVNPTDRVLTEIRKAFNLQQTHNITVRWDNSLVEEEDSFEDCGMEDDAILLPMFEWDT